MSTITRWIPVAGARGLIIDRDQHKDRYRLRLVEEDGTTCEVVIAGDRYATLKALLALQTPVGDEPVLARPVFNTAWGPIYFASGVLERLVEARGEAAILVVATDYLARMGHLPDGDYVARRLS